MSTLASDSTTGRLTRSLRALYSSVPPREFRLEQEVYGDLETRSDPKTYCWDGLKRSIDPAHRFVVFQYTLQGWGAYENGSLQKVAPGMAFSAVVPSDHRYYLPADCPRWEFFWIIIRHPYVVSRIVQQVKAVGAVLSIPPDSVVVARAVHLLEGLWTNGFRDSFAREQALFEFLFEYERFVHQSIYPQADRQRLLEETRQFVLENLSDPIDVQTLADLKSMSRSHYSHHFKSVTGLSPARFITETRLQEVTRRLVRGRDTLKTIAADCGFADANHLCKVFRRHYHISPGGFRRQMS